MCLGRGYERGVIHLLRLLCRREYETEMELAMVNTNSANLDDRAVLGIRWINSECYFGVG